MEDTHEHFVGKVAQKAILEKSGKVLLVRDSRDPNATVWDLPGGRLHLNEEPREGLRREIREELGVDVDVHEVLDVNQFLQTFSKTIHFLVVYRATLSDPEQPLMLDPSEIAEAQWVSAEALSSYQLYESYTRALEFYFNKPV